LTEDQKKKLVVGGGVGALALVVGYAIFSGRPAMAAPVQPLFPVQRVPPRGDRKRKKRRHDDEAERGSRGDHGDNGRGEYDRKKKHKRRHHGD